MVLLALLCLYINFLGFVLQFIDEQPNEIFSSDEDLCEEDFIINFLEEGDGVDQNFEQPNPDGGPDDPDDDFHVRDNDDDESDSEYEDVEEGDHFSIDDDTLNTLVVQGRQRTRREVLLLNLAVASKNCATYEMLLDMLRSWNAGLGRPGMMPSSKKALRRLLKRSDAGICKHAYCPNINCKKYLGKLKTLQRLGEPVQCHCGRIIPLSKLKWFVSVSLRKQLQKFLTTPGIFNLLNYRQTREKFNEDSIEDIFDGELYQELIQKGLISDNNNNYTFVFNSDGFSLYKNHSLNIWVLLVRLNELPPALRQRHLFLAGLWIDTGKPNMNSFLRPFVREANHLSNQGIEWRPDDGVQITSRFFPIACCVDAQARCAILNMSQYNGYYGCFLCTHRGVQLGGSGKYPLLPYQDLPAAQNRSHESIRDGMLRNEFFEGHLGPSQILLLEHYDMARGNGIDDLHAYYEGVASFLFELLVPLLHDEEEALRIIDHRMNSVRSPIQISRKWKSITKRTNFKGSQWGTFIRYFMVLCLMDNNLDEPYLELVSLLSYCLFVISRDSITAEELNRVRAYIGMFLERFQRFFGPTNMRANIHFLSHAVKSVMCLGPTWTISCFNFESWNRKVGNNVTSPKGVFDQIIDRHFMKCLLHESVHRNNISREIQDELHTLLFASPRKDAQEIEDGVVVLGNAKPRRATEEEQRLLGVACEGLLEFDRVLVRGVEYRNKTYHDGTQSDNSIALTWNEQFVTISSIIVVDNNGLQSCKLLVDEHHVDYPIRFAHHIAHHTGHNEHSCIQAKSLRVPAIKMCVREETYFVPMSNCCEID